MSSSSPPPSPLSAWRDAAVANFAVALRSHSQKTASRNVTSERSGGEEHQQRATMGTSTPAEQHQSGAPERSTRAEHQRAAARPKSELSELNALRLAARRAASEEAHARRAHVAKLATALRTPLLRANVRAWRAASDNGYRALLLRRRLGMYRAMLRWWASHDAAIEASMRRWLRRWWCVLRAANGRAEREDAVARATRRRTLRRVMAALRAQAARADREYEATLAIHRRTARRVIGRLTRHAQIAGPQREAQRAAAGKLRAHCIRDLQLWRRVAVTRSSRQRRCALRLSLRKLSVYTRLHERAQAGPALLALCHWRRRFEGERSRRQLGAGLRALRVRARARQDRRARADTLAAAAAWTSARSAAQCVLAHMLLIGWRRRQHAEQYEHALLFATHRALTETLRLWRLAAIRRAERRATRRHIVRGVRSPNRQTVAAEELSDDALHADMGGGGGLGEHGGGCGGDTCIAPSLSSLRGTRGFRARRELLEQSHAQAQAHTAHKPLLKHHAPVGGYAMGAQTSGSAADAAANAAADAAADAAGSLWEHLSLQLDPPSYLELPPLHRSSPR